MVLVIKYENLYILSTSSYQTSYPLHAENLWKKWWQGLCEVTAHFQGQRHHHNLFYGALLSKRREAESKGEREK